MGLRLKFNLVLLLVFALGLGVTGFISHELLHRNARDEVLRNAGVMMEAALSMRGYTNTQIRPLIPYDNEVFPSAERARLFGHRNHERRCARSTRIIRTRKRRSIPPTRATGRWSGKRISSMRFATIRSAREISGVRDTPTGQSLYLARPFQIKDKACLGCHTTAAEAPPAMVKIYGPNNGYGWKHMEVIGAQIVSVPMSLPIQQRQPRVLYLHDFAVGGISWRCSSSST